MINHRLPTWRFFLIAALAVAAAGPGSGCKKTPVDEALVLFNVQVDTNVPTFSTLRFTVDDRTGVPPRTVDGEAGHRPTFRFGYYMPGINGDVTVHGRALDAAGCTIGEGTLKATGIHAGKPTDAGMLTIARATGGCPGDGPAEHPDGPAGDGLRDGHDGGPEAGGDAPVDGPPGKKNNGDSCLAGGECTSTFCVDGVCCEGLCAGSCEACAEGSMKGMCVAVTGAPRMNHPGCAGTGACAGTCDGAERTACTYPGMEKECRAAACAASMATIRAVCDGKGACPALETVACAPNSCAGTMCAGGCSATQPCTGDNYCRGGVCTPRKANGQTCAGVDECTSGNCVDNTCCNAPCQGACQACNLTAAPGTCSPVKSATDDTCNGIQTCDAAGACKKAAGQGCTGAAECASTFCVDGRCCGSSSCATCRSCTGGGGTCVLVTAQEDLDSCANTSICDGGGVCRKKTGQSCASNGDCLTNICSNDSICCTTACALACQGCALANTNVASGTCAIRASAAAGTQVCNGACANTQTSVTNCGSCGSSCPTPGQANSVAACNGGSCGFACASGFSLCTSTSSSSGPICHPTSWGFEGGDKMNWTNTCETAFTDSMVRAHTGSWSDEGYASSSAQFPARVFTYFYCGGTTTFDMMDLRGRQLSAWVYLSGVLPAGFVPNCRPFGFRQGTTEEIFNQPTVPTVGQWFQVSGTFSNQASQVIGVGVECVLPTEWNNGTANTERWYIDDVVIN